MPLTCFTHATASQAWCSNSLSYSGGGDPASTFYKQWHPTNLYYPVRGDLGPYPSQIVVVLPRVHDLLVCFSQLVYSTTCPTQAEVFCSMNNPMLWFLAEMGYLRFSVQHPTCIYFSKSKVSLETSLRHLILQDWSLQSVL